MTPSLRSNDDRVRARKLAVARSASLPVQRAPALPSQFAQTAQQAPHLLQADDVMAAQRSLGNQAVQRLLANPTPANQNSSPVQVQRKTTQSSGVAQSSSVPQIQRVPDEEKIQHLKEKRVKAKFGRAGLKFLDVLLTLPIRVIDELSIADLHAKDLVNFARTGKTYKERRSQTPLAKYTKGVARRGLGRTGLRGYLSGKKSHKIMSGKALHNFDLPWAGKFNPFYSLGAEQGRLKNKARGYKTNIRNMRRTPIGTQFRAPKSEVEEQVTTGSVQDESTLVEPSSLMESSSMEDYSLPELPDSSMEEEGEES